jgi:linoleoyl-CoA desaturase
MTVVTPSKTTSAEGKPTGGSRTRPGKLAESGSPTVRPPAAAHLSDEQVAELGRELDAVRDEILAKRGAADAAYIRVAWRSPGVPRCWSARTRLPGLPEPRC